MIFDTIKKEILVLLVKLILFLKIFTVLMKFQQAMWAHY